MSLIPLPVGKAVNKDDAVLHQGLGSDELVVGGIVDHVNDPGLPCAACVHLIKCHQGDDSSQFYSSTSNILIKLMKQINQSFSGSLLSPLAFSSRTGQSYHHGKACIKQD